MRATVIGFICAVLAGCATVSQNQAVVTFDSQPPGAMLYENTVALGMAPQTRSYTLKPGQTVLKPVPITAVWVSGAKVTQPPSVRLGAKQNINFSRPIDAPDLDKDLAFANQLMQNATAKQQANAATRQADAANAAVAIQLLNQSQPRAYAPPPTQQPRMVNCTTTRDATGALQTNCF